MTRNQIEYWNLNETRRHNVTTENETVRHNQASESETNRHNVVSEGIDLGQLSETARHNRAGEAVAQQNVQLGLGTLSENIRHNRASEALTGTDLNIRSSIAAETARHNAVTEGIDQSRATVDNALTEAKTAYQDIVNTWENVQRMKNVNLTTAQIDQANAYLDQIKAATDKLQKEAAWYGYDEILKSIQQINNYLNTGAKYIDAFVPF